MEYITSKAKPNFCNKRGFSKMIFLLYILDNWFGYTS